MTFWNLQIFTWNQLLNRECQKSAIFDTFYGKTSSILLFSHNFSTVWKFSNFYVTHILREINCWQFEVPKTGILNILAAPKFVFLKLFDIFKFEMSNIDLFLILRKILTFFSVFQLGKNIVDYQNQAKRLFKTLTATSPIKCSIESGPYLFQ